jgi:hypothetical protein
MLTSKDAMATIAVMTFEHYDLPDTSRKGDIHVAGETRVAWLKDPDGNILALVSG